MVRYSTISLGHGISLRIAVDFYGSSDHSFGFIRSTSQKWEAFLLSSLYDPYWPLCVGPSGVIDKGFQSYSRPDVHQRPALHHLKLDILTWVKVQCFNQRKPLKVMLSQVWLFLHYY